MGLGLEIGVAVVHRWAGWKQLWGAAGVRQPRELLPVQAFDARRWPLEHLYLKMPDPPGANLERLGLLPKRKR